MFVFKGSECDLLTELTQPFQRKVRTLAFLYKKVAQFNVFYLNLFKMLFQAPRNIRSIYGVTLKI